ncbi:MAG: alpha/beta hydrolase [Chloroflexota bacterium]
MQTGKPVDLHYLDEGQGEPVLMLHGLGSQAADWQLQLPILSKSYRVIVPDVRGHGMSPKPPGPYTMTMMSADVLALLKRLDLDAVHVIGLSMGGMIGFQMAVDRPEIVRSLVVVNSTPDLVPRTLGQHLQAQQRLWLARLAQPRRTGEFLSRKLFPKPEQEPFREMLVTQWAANDKAAYMAAMEACIGWSVLPDVGNIRCPVLVVSGDRDYLPLEAKRMYTDMMPNARLEVVADSGHATPIDQAEIFNRLILEFLESVN